MPQKKKRRVPWNKINNQHNSAATTSSFSQGLPVAVPGPSTNFQPYQAEIAKLHPLPIPDPSRSTNNNNQSSQFGRPPNVVFLGLPTLPRFSFSVPFPNATHLGQGNISSPINPNSAAGRALSFPSPSGPNFFARLKTDILLDIMENLPGEDVIALRRAVPQILRVLATNDHTSKIWRTVRLAAGVPAAENGKERPSPTEFTQIRYVLETHCMACGDCNAYRQWDFGFRLCSDCLTPRVTTLRDFIDEHSEFANNWGKLREGIPWVAAGSVPGLVGVGGALVARKAWADQVARDLKFSLARRKLKEIQKDTEIINSCILKDLKNSRSFAISIEKLHPVKISSAFTLARLTRQRQKWFTMKLLAITSMKFAPADIPQLHDSEWRRIMCKLSEPGKEDEWDERQTRLRLMTRSHRNTRLAASVHHYPPPLPGVDHGYSQNANQDLSHYYVGPLPATVFLKICMLSDVKTTMALERTCSAACLILRSSTAEITWRHLRLAAGLETKYPAWSDRQFLRFAFRRLCYCGSEGVTFWMFAMTLCGDCFAKHVTTTEDTLSNVGKDLKQLCLVFIRRSIRHDGGLNQCLMAYDCFHDIMLALFKTGFLKFLRRSRNNYLKTF